MSMIRELFKRGIIGVGFGAISTFIALTVLKFKHIDSSVDEIWWHMLAGMAVGIYFGWSSLIWEHRTWNPLKKLIIHFSLSIIVYFSIAFPVGWISPKPFLIFLNILVFIAIYFLFWLGALFYYRKQTETLNEQLQNRH